ncbi:hypothetical protein [Allosphingosinicella indica]|uniref:Uncharacterized protein n=1 Tax=Allosphingosinicella indica TaxID=941907 RepID=A0A1X7GD00_9SPHN|nr:hypothetical protein [Allosphingosinicella indica]SMF67937.1 hypothetical protein SAMN06295910_1575 [Allosphingosinicella indica]
MTAVHRPIMRPVVVKYPMRFLLAFAGVAAAALAMPAAAQQSDGRLGDILESLPPEDGAVPLPEADAPFAPRVTPPPPSAMPPGPVQPVVTSRTSSGIGIADLPPSQVVSGPYGGGERPADMPFGPPTDDPANAPRLGGDLAETEDDPAAEPVAVADAEGVNPYTDDAAEPAEPVILTAEQQQAIWEENERARLAEADRRMAARAEEILRAREARAAEYEAQIAARQAEMEAQDADYRRTLDEARQNMERDRAAWEARVRACRAGDQSACATREERRRY